MFGNKESSVRVGSGSTTLIAKGTKVVGELHFSGNLEIEGVVKGNIVADTGVDSALVRVQSSGEVHGFQYGFTFDELLAEDDAVIERDGVSLVVDSMSYQYLLGGTVDYVEGLEGSRFVVNNPNAETTCGCGSSFSM